MSKSWTHEDVEDRLVRLRDLLKVRFKDSPIKTFSRIGSSAFPGYSASLWSNDVDTAIIADPVTLELLEEVDRISAGICEELTDDIFDVEYVIRSGPMKLADNPEKSHILLHHAVYDSGEYQNESVLLRYSWKHTEDLLIGSSLVETADADGLTFDDMVHAHSGLLNCIEMLERKITRYKGWERAGGKVTPVLKEMAVDGVDLMEIAFYSVLNTTMNIMRVVTGEPLHHCEKLWRSFASSFSIPSANLAIEFFSLKKKIREGTQRVDEQLVKKVVASSLGFLRECEEAIEKQKN